jgi:heptosyltransferase-2
VASSLVVQTSFIGDVILSTPLIARLAETGDVDVVATPVGATVLANNPNIRRLLVYDKRRRDQGIIGFAQVVMQARRSGRAARVSPAGAPKAPYYRDAKHLCTGPRDSDHTPQPDRRAYLAQGSIRSAALALAAGYKQRTGFDTSSGRVLYTNQVRYREDWHHARRLLALADETYAATINDAELQPRLYPGIEDVAVVDRLLQGRGGPLVVVAPGSVWETKRWPYYGELSQMLGRDWDVAIVGGADDANSAAEILRRLPAKRVVDTIGKLSLLGSAELIGRAAVVVSNDSAPQHLASAMGTPTVTVFGPTVPDFGFGPLAPHSRVVGRDGLGCRPCDKHGPRRCPLGHWKCMRDVSAVNVYDAVIQIIRQGVTP